MVMISRNTIRFNCPIKNVPTKDNVLISIDVGVNFHIGRDLGRQILTKDDENEQQKIWEEDSRKFFYNFGPNRLEELLSQEVDEGIRSFVRDTRVHRIRDAKTEIVAAMTQELVDKFMAYGVVIEQVNIMKVLLPENLRNDLMWTTSYDVALQKQVKEKNYKLLQIQNTE